MDILDLPMGCAGVDFSGTLRFCTSYSELANHVAGQFSDSRGELRVMTLSRWAQRLNRRGIWSGRPVRENRSLKLPRTYSSQCIRNLDVLGSGGIDRVGPK